MSYSEENGEVVLRMSREDWEIVEYCLQIGIDEAVGDGVYSEAETDGLLNRINEGNPNYTPYKLEGKS